QTERLALYEAALGQLQTQELVYPCTCSRSDVEQAASAPHLEHEGPVYPGICARRDVADAAAFAGKPYCWRLRARADSSGCVDGFCGLVGQDVKKFGGDFVVWKSAGTPAYQLAVVVDDAALGVT